MKKNLSLFAVLAICGSLSASVVQVDSGWSLISTAGENNVYTDCILNQLARGSLVWKYKNNQWYAKSNSQQINNIISKNPRIDFVNNIGLKEGFWVYNSGSSVNIDMSCSNMSGGNSKSDLPQFTYGNKVNFVFGNEVNATVYDVFQAGHVFFGIGHVDGYEKTIVNPNSSITNKIYRYNGTNFVLDGSFDINITIDSNNNFSYSTPDGERVDIFLNWIKNVTSIDGENTESMGLKYISLTTYYPVKRIGEWEPAGLTVEYNGQNVTDIVTFKNILISPNSDIWFGEPNDNVWMFEASSNTDITSGNIVKGHYDGNWSNCSSNDEYICKKFSRTNQVIGEWRLTNGILRIITTKFEKEWKFDNGQLYERDVDRAVSSENWFLLWADDPTSLETAIRNHYN